MIIMFDRNDVPESCPQFLVSIVLRAMYTSPFQMVNKPATIKAGVLPSDPHKGKYMEIWMQQWVKT